MSTLDRLLASPATHPAAAAARARLLEAGLPARGHEDWRHANLAALDSVASLASPAGAADPSPALPAPIDGYARLVLAGGGLSGPLPPGLVPVAPSPASADPRGLLRFARLAEAHVPVPLAFEVRGALDLELLVVPPGEGAAHSALELRLAPGARLRLAERHAGPIGSRSLACHSLRLALAAGASLEHQRLLALDGEGVHLDTLEARLEADARYQQRCLAVGAGTLRSTQSIVLTGRGASLDWQGLAVANGRGVRDLMLALAHEAPDTASQQVFRGIADGRARVACAADSLVAATAPGTRLSQSLRGLLEGETAEVDLRPRLTILTDAVQAAHGATTGRLDDDLLFYLLARGLEATEARALLKWAFLGEVFAGLEPAPLRLVAEQAIAARLRDRPPGELLR